MPNVIQHKRNSTPGAVPTTGSLSQGELGINIGDGKLYTKNTNNTIINVGVSSISGTAITPASGNFSGYLAVNSVPVSVSGHSHGNISNSGTIGSIAGRPLITIANGVVTTGVFGSTSGTFCQGNDSRLSDDRNPLSHTHYTSDILTTSNADTISNAVDDLVTYYLNFNGWPGVRDVLLEAAPSSHSHGNITTSGAIGVTANRPLITTTNGVITTGVFGSSVNTFCQGNDPRLSDARTPLSHTHSSSDITNFNSSVSGLVSGVYVPVTRTITPGSGLIGSSALDLSTDRILHVGQGDGLIVSADAIAVNNTVLRTTGDQVINGEKKFRTPIYAISGIVINGHVDFTIPKYGNQLDIAYQIENDLYLARFNTNSNVNLNSINLNAVTTFNTVVGDGSLPFIISPTGYSGSGAITQGFWRGSAIEVDKGGTGRSTYSNGQLLIGSGTSLASNTLTSSTGISIINGSGSITVATTGLSFSTHTHGNISSSGTIGTVSGIPLITTANGVVTTGVFGNTSGTFCQGNDSRLTGTELMLDVHNCINDPISPNQDNILIYDMPDSDPYSAYDINTGSFTVPSGKGGIYAIQITFVAGGTMTSTERSAGLKIEGNTIGQKSINLSVYAPTDDNYRTNSLGMVYLPENETVNVLIYPTDEVSPNNDVPFFNSVQFYRL